MIFYKTCFSIYITHFSVNFTNFVISATRKINGRPLLNAGGRFDLAHFDQP